MTSYIYFIQAQGDGPIKIGTTGDDPRKRMVKIQSDCPWPVKLIGAITGSFSQEKQIHLVLSRFRTQGEWFEPHPIVLAAVKTALEVGEALEIGPDARAPKYDHPLCRYRSENGLTLADIAPLVGTSHASISRIESGRNPPGWELACRISQVTGIHVSLLRPDIFFMLFPEKRAAQ